MRVNEVWELTPQRVAIHVPTATAVIADIHLGYAQARRRQGESVPVVPVAESLAPLGIVLAEHRVRRLAVAGDLFQDRADREVLDEFLAWVRDRGVAFAGLVPGNHDRDIDNHWRTLRLYPEGLAIGAWTVLHGDRPLPAAPVVHGHIHPCFRVGTVGAACYLVGLDRIVLPAFSADAAGVNVLHDAEWADYRCVVSTGAKLLDFGLLRRAMSAAT